MIKIRTKTNFPFIIIASIFIIITIIGFISCEHKHQRTVELNNKITKETIEKDKRKIEIETDKDGDTNQAVQPVRLGNFKLTAYCSCSLCCGKWALNRPIDKNGNTIVYGSIGERLIEGYSIAVDPSVIPYGAKVIINGRTYKAQDCGGAIKGKRIDVYFENHQDALNYGVQYAEVFTM